jgi:hypothetical protein
MTDGYPESPGWRRGPNSATSEAAAVLAAGRAPSLKHQILSMLKDRPATPEELESRFHEAGAKVLLNTIRARCSDLHAAGKLLPSGTYGIGESGKARTIRWRLADAEELALFAARRAAHLEKMGGDQ